MQKFIATTFIGLFLLSIQPMRAETPSNTKDHKYPKRGEDIKFYDSSKPEMPPKVEGENFQRVEDKDFIDCQQFWVSSLEGSHPEIQKTVCAYRVFLVGKDAEGKRKDIPMLMLIEKDPKTGQISTGYIPDPGK